MCFGLESGKISGVITIDALLVLLLMLLLLLLLMLLLLLLSSRFLSAAWF